MSAVLPGPEIDGYQLPDVLFRRPLVACPWCSSESIAFRVRLSDTRQCKPGIFHVDECRDCGHVFQNPRPTPAALAYYRRDCYDGVGRENYASMAARSGRANRARLRHLAGLPRPRRWLEVGARQGHLCRDIRPLLPGTEIWAVEPSTEILLAADRGWLDVPVRDPLTELAGTHPGWFDVVSMVNYLERTEDPRAELAAARRLLRPGGAILLETVNPESAFARLYGNYWFGWLAPQNLNLIPWRNLCRTLAENGFELRDMALGAANKPFDNVAALMTALNYHLPPARRWPWSGIEVPAARKAFRHAVVAAAAPLAVLAVLVDQLLHAVTVRGRGGNAYRVAAVRT